MNLIRQKEALIYKIHGYCLEIKAKFGQRKENMTEGKDCQALFTFSILPQISLIFQDCYQVFGLSCNIRSHFMPQTSYF